MPAVFSIADVPLLRTASGAVFVDIGYLANNDHLEAFVEIFAKFVRDNEDTIRGYDQASVLADKIVPAVTIQQIRERPKDVARLLYLSLNSEVRLLLQRGPAKKELLIGFDNPSFEFVNAL